MPLKKDLTPFISTFNTAKIEFLDIEDCSPAQKAEIDSFLEQKISSFVSYDRLKKNFQGTGFNIAGVVAIDKHYRKILGAILFAFEYYSDHHQNNIHVHTLGVNPQTVGIRHGIGSLLLLVVASIGAKENMNKLTLIPLYDSRIFYEKIGMIHNEKNPHFFYLPFDKENQNKFDCIKNKYQHQSLGIYNQFLVRLVSENELAFFEAYILDDITQEPRHKIIIVGLPIHLKIPGSITKLHIYFHNFNLLLKNNDFTETVYYGIYFSQEDVAAYKIQRAYLKYKKAGAYQKHEAQHAKFLASLYQRK